MKPLLFLLAPLAMMGQTSQTCTNPAGCPGPSIFMETPHISFSTYIYANGPALRIEYSCRCVKIDTQDESLVIHEDNTLTGSRPHSPEEARLIIFLVDTIVGIADANRPHRHWQDLLKGMSK